MLDPVAASPRRIPSWLATLIVPGLVVAFVGLVWAGLGELGMTWDEPYFFERQHEIGAWFGDLLGSGQDRARAFSAAGLERSWRVGRAVPDQHPPVPELLSLVTGQALGWLIGPLRAYRVATVLVFAVAAGVLVRLVAPRWGPWAAGAALGTLLFNPRLFAHAQQITADADTGAFWFLAAVALLRFTETGRRPWLFGVCAGLAIMCKATGILLFPAALLWIVIHRPRGGWRPLAWSIPIVPLVMLAVMPPWWAKPGRRRHSLGPGVSGLPAKGAGLLPGTRLRLGPDVPSLAQHDRLDWHDGPAWVAAACGSRVHRRDGAARGEGGAGIPATNRRLVPWRTGRSSPGRRSTSRPGWSSG